jgi:hypothetical protein
MPKPDIYFIYLGVMKLPRTDIIIWALAGIKVLVHLLTMFNYGLQRDAYLYYILGENLDWGFVSVPPLIGVISWFSTSIFGNTVFALRIFPALIGGLSVVVIGKLVSELKGQKIAVLLACLAFVLSPGFMRSNSLFQPVSFNQFAWLLSAYFLVRLVNRNDPKAWFPLMITWGIAFQNKYSITFFILASLAALLLSPYRKIFLTKYFLFAGLSSILLILPNIIWQHLHGWPVIHHMSELQRTQLVNVTLLGFIIDQLVINFPGIIVWVTGLVIFLSRKELRNYRFLVYIYFFTILILILLRGKGYYALGLYPMLFALGGVAIEKYFNKWAVIITVVFMVVSFSAMAPLSLPMLSYEKMAAYSKPMAPVVNRWEDGEVHDIPQDFADMTGWEELGKKVAEFYLSLDEKTQKEVHIYGENYGHAGAISFYGKEYGLPEVICFNDNFVLWAPCSIEKAPMIYVNHEVGDLDELYLKVELVYEIDNPYFRENGLKIYYCTQPTDILQPFYAEKVAEIKSRYVR